MRNRINIAFVLPDLRGGGAEGVFVKLSNYLANTHDVFLFVGKFDGVNKKNLNKNVKTFELGSVSGLKSIKNIFQLCKSHNIDFLLGTLGMAHAVAISKFFLGKKTVCLARLGNTISAEQAMISSPVKRLIHAMYQKVLFFADHVVVQSEYMLKDATNHLPSSAHISLIHNPVELPLNIPNVERSETQIEQNFKFVLIGRLAEQKDPLTALTAFNNLYKSRKSIELHILGTGDLEISLKKFVKENFLEKCVFFHGYQHDVYSYMKASDALLLSSKYEGFSNVVIEALSIGLPVVATDSPGGNRDVLVHKYNCFLAKVGDSDEFKEGMEFVMDNEINYDFNVSRFSLEAISNQYIRLYHE